MFGARGVSGGQRLESLVITFLQPDIESPIKSLQMLNSDMTNMLSTHGVDSNHEHMALTQ